MVNRLRECRSVFVSERFLLWKESRLWFEEECLRSQRGVRERVGFDLPIQSDRRSVRIDRENGCSVEEIVILQGREDRQLCSMNQQVIRCSLVGEGDRVALRLGGVEYWMSV